MARRVVTLKGCAWYGVNLGHVLTAEDIRRAQAAHPGKRPPKGSTQYVKSAPVRKAPAAPRAAQPRLAEVLPPATRPTISGPKKLKFDVLTWGVPQAARVAQGPRLESGPSYWVLDQLGILRLLYERHLETEVRVVESAVPRSVADEVRSSVFRT